VLSQVLTQIAVDPNPTPVPWRVLTMVAYFVGLLTTFGGTLLYVLVVAPVLARPSVDPADRDVLRRRAALTLAVIGTWFLIALYLQLAGKVARVKGEEIPFSEALLPTSVIAYLTKPGAPDEWMSVGAQAAVQYATWAVAAVLLILLWNTRAHLHTARLAGVAYVIAFLAYAVTWVPTNPAEETFDSALDGFLNHMHVLAVSTWVGGLATLAILATARRRLTPGAGAVWAQIWARFSTVALTAVGVMVVSGTWLTWKYVVNFGDLFTTEFGRILLLKVSLVATMVAIGGANELLLMPRIARARAAGAEGSVFRLAANVFPRLVAVEATLGLGVLFALAFLTGSARAETGVDEPVVDGGVIMVGIVMIAALTISLVTTARVCARLGRPATPAVPVG
jgi:copper transport protein